MRREHRDAIEADESVVTRSLTIKPLSVSVAMATYNGGRFLKDQLQSIADQTVLPLELVICDDASSDDTVDIAEHFAKSAPFPVRIHRNRGNLGYILNFRSAISRCSGDLIALCDQDDWWLPERIESCVSRFSDPELLLVYHNALIVDDERRKIGHLFDLTIEERALSLRPIGPWNFSNGLVQMFRADLRRFDDLWDQSLSHVRDGILAHDRWYFFLAQALGRVEFLNEPLVEYRQHGSNTFGADGIRPSVELRFLSRLRHFGSQDLVYANAAEARGRILRQIASRVPDQAARLLRIAQLYELLSERNRRRYRTYSGSTFLERFASLVSSWRNSDYMGWPWGFDRRSVIRDIWSGVLLARR